MSAFFRRLFVGLVAALLLSGCLTLSVHTRLQASGAAERTVAVAVDSVLLQTAAIQPLESLQRVAEASGWSVERFRDAARDQEGVRLRRTLSSLEDLNQLPEGDPLAGLERITVETQGDLQVLTATLSMAGILERLRIAAGEPPLSPEDLSLLRAAGFRLGYELELPGPVIDYTPRGNAWVDGRRIRWEVPLSPDQPVATLRVTWRPIRYLPVCAGGMIGVFPFLLLLALRTRKEGWPSGWKGRLSRSGLQGWLACGVGRWSRPA